MAQLLLFSLSLVVLLCFGSSLFDFASLVAIYGDALGRAREKSKEKDIDKLPTTQFSTLERQSPSTRDGGGQQVLARAQQADQEPRMQTQPKSAQPSADGRSGLVRRLGAWQHTVRLKRFRGSALSMLRPQTTQTTPILVLGGYPHHATTRNTSLLNILARVPKALWI